LCQNPTSNGNKAIAITNNGNEVGKMWLAKGVEKGELRF